MYLALIWISQVWRARNKKSSSCRLGKIYVYIYIDLASVQIEDKDNTYIISTRTHRRAFVRFFFFSFLRNFPRLYYPIVLTVCLYTLRAARFRGDYPAAKSI